MLPFQRCIVVLLLGAAALAQTGTAGREVKPDEERRVAILKPGGSVPIGNEPGGLLLLPVLCDEEGNLYFRRYEIDLPEVAPIVKVSRSGEVKESFRLAAAGNPNLRAADFFVDGGGHFFLQAYSVDKEHPHDQWIIEYDKDGQVKSKTKLDGLFDPSGHFAVFPSGEYLVSTVEEQPPEMPGLSNKPYTAVFASNGKLIKRVVTSTDEKLETAAKNGEPGYASSRGVGGNFAVLYGAVAAGSDGNIYVMRRTAPATIFAISPAGEVVKSFEVDSGIWGLHPARLQAAKGRLAIMFKNPGPDAKDTRMKVVDLDGNDIETFDVDPGLGTAFVCYAPPQFTFLHERANKRIVLQAKPE